MTTYAFRAYALSPIHVGSGQEIDPLAFVLLDKRLVHFNTADVVRDLPQEERQRFLQILDRADLRALQSFLKSHVAADRHGLVTVDVSKRFKTEYEQRASNPDRQFRVEMMPRNPHSGKAFLPGSSIKGAIRTAVVNYFANIDPRTKSSVEQAMRIAGAPQNKAQILEEVALGRRQSQTERDVFRFIEVEDVVLPDASTRIDRAVNWNPRKPGSENIQMWVERVKAQADAPGVPQFEVRLHMNTQAMHHPKVRKQLGRTLDFDTLIEACRRFYWERMVAEGEAFDGKKHQGKSWKAIYDLFPKGKTPEGDIVPISPPKSYWCTAKRKRILLRVGRFSHFESLSVDHFRQGYNVQARRPIQDMGSTRTRCEMENGLPLMPFGWLLLTLDL